MTNNPKTFKNIMKPIQIHKDLLRRIEAAAANGSKVASIILNDLNGDAEEKMNSKTTNFFDCVRRVSDQGAFKTVVIEITCCAKDLDNDNFPDKGNPKAPFYMKNRARKSPVAFAKMFNSVNDAYNKGEISQTDYDYFDDAIRVPSKLTVEYGTDMTSFEKAYLCCNYTDYADTTDSTLHKSCMRYDSVVPMVTDFYANCVNTGILYVRDEDGNVYGRAILWKNVNMEVNGDIYPNMSLLDRIYTTFAFVRQMIIDKATGMEIMFRKEVDSYNEKRKIRALNDVVFESGVKLSAGGVCSLRMFIDVPLRDDNGYKYGAPYMDTFTYLFRCGYENDATLRLWNVSERDDECVLAELDKTYGSAGCYQYVCPVCGDSVSSQEGYIDHICSSCRPSDVKPSVVGALVRADSFVEYNNTSFPKECFDSKGKPRVPLLIHEIHARMCGLSRFK